MTLCSHSLVDDIIARLADSHSHFDGKHGGHHLRGLQHHGESLALAWLGLARGGWTLTHVM